MQDTATKICVVQALFYFISELPLLGPDKQLKFLGTTATNGKL